MYIYIYVYTYIYALNYCLLAFLSFLIQSSGSIYVIAFGIEKVF